MPRVEVYTPYVMLEAEPVSDHLVVCRDKPRETTQALLVLERLIEPLETLAKSMAEKVPTNVYPGVKFGLFTGMRRADLLSDIQIADYVPPDSVYMTTDFEPKLDYQLRQTLTYDFWESIYTTGQREGICLARVNDIGRHLGVYYLLRATPQSI